MKQVVDSLFSRENINEWLLWKIPNSIIDLLLFWLDHFDDVLNFVSGADV